MCCFSLKYDTYFEVTDQSPSTQQGSSWLKIWGSPLCWECYLANFFLQATSSFKILECFHVILSSLANKMRTVTQGMRFNCSIHERKINNLRSHCSHEKTVKTPVKNENSDQKKNFYYLIPSPWPPSPQNPHNNSSSDIWGHTETETKTLSSALQCV